MTELYYPEPMQVIPAAQRTAQQWVDYYLQIENDVLAGKDVSFNDGRRVVMEDLKEIRKARADWERRVKIQAAGKAPHNFGGLSYKTADLTR